MELIQVLKERFEKNEHRHPRLKWETIEQKLDETALKKIEQMEKTDGQPDLIVFQDKLLYVDFSKESPAERRSLCYDKEALDKRKENKPQDSAVNFANSMGVTLLTEEEYYYMQQLEDFDLKTSSWVETPEEIRKQGGALFCNKKYGRSFTGFNGADSYYAARGFRAKVEL